MCRISEHRERRIWNRSPHFSSRDNGRTLECEIRDSICSTPEGVRLKAKRCRVTIYLNIKKLLIRLPLCHTFLVCTCRFFRDVSVPWLLFMVYFLHTEGFGPDVVCFCCDWLQNRKLWCYMKLMRTAPTLSILWKSTLTLDFILQRTSWNCKIGCELNNNTCRCERGVFSLLFDKYQDDRGHLVLVKIMFPTWTLIEKLWVRITPYKFGCHCSKYSSNDESQRLYKLKYSWGVRELKIELNMRIDMVLVYTGARGHHCKRRHIIIRVRRNSLSILLLFVSVGTKFWRFVKK